MKRRYTLDDVFDPSISAQEHLKRSRIYYAGTRTPGGRAYPGPAPAAPGAAMPYRPRARARFAPASIKRRLSLKRRGRSSTPARKRYASRSTKFRKFRSLNRKTKRKVSLRRSVRAPAWGRGAMGKYMSRSVVVRDNGTFNMSRTGDNKQNLQTYYMDWAALSNDLDAWLINAGNHAAIGNVARHEEIFVQSVKKHFTFSNNASFPCEIDCWVVMPKRRYSDGTAPITGADPTIVTQTVLTETGTTAFSYEVDGHEPYMSSYFAEAFKMKKVSSKRLPPGGIWTANIFGKGGVYSKLKYGIASADGFNTNHTILKGLSSYGLLFRAKGVLVHDESKVPVVGVENVNGALSVARGGFNLDCQWIRHARYKVPCRFLVAADSPGLMYHGYDIASLTTMTQANESRFGENFPEVEMKL